jgi:hypothetical protein
MFLALLERQRVATETAFFPFACLLAQGHNLAPFIKKTKHLSPEDFMPRRKLKGLSDIRRGPLPESAYHAFKKVQAVTGGV